MQAWTLCWDSLQVEEKMDQKMGINAYEEFLPKHMNKPHLEGLHWRNIGANSIWVSSALYLLCKRSRTAYYLCHATNIINMLKTQQETSFVKLLYYPHFSTSKTH